MGSINRCAWSAVDPLLLEYHDKEWGVPIYDDNKLFEFIVLEGMQAGLSWLTILKKRNDYRLLFDNFDPNKIAKYKQPKKDKLLTDARIIRNRLKIASIITNAQAYLKIKKEWPSFSAYIWHFVDEKPLQNQWKLPKQIPATNHVSDRMAKDMKKRGFKFVGSTICYAFMQAVGMVNDHLTDCFRYKKLAKSSRKKTDTANSG